MSRKGASVIFFPVNFSVLHVSSHPAPFSASVDQLGDFDTIIDVRSPSEYAEDHVPGEINCPVLDDEERARVGTLYKQVSPFEARKVGTDDRPKRQHPMMPMQDGATAQEV